MTTDEQGTKDRANFTDTTRHRRVSSGACPARGDDGPCEAGNPEDRSVCRFCGGVPPAARFHTARLRVWTHDRTARTASFLTLQEAFDASDHGDDPDVIVNDRGDLCCLASLPLGTANCGCPRCDAAPPAVPAPASALTHPAPSAMARAVYPDDPKLEPWEVYNLGESRATYAAGAAAERARVAKVLRERADGIPGLWALARFAEELEAGDRRG